MIKSVLIIDDDRQSRSALRHILESLNCEVYEAADGQEGIDSFRKNPTDIVVTDIFIPGKDGLEVIWDLRNEFPGTEIIVISGVETGSMDYFQAAIDSGAARCIRKPISVRDIKGIVG